ncbi:MAG: TylF/MycF/NovP-related O-methyltransferase [Opitutaceae bacterium]
MAVLETTPALRTHDNFALARLFNWWRQPGGERLRRVNRRLGRWRVPFVLQGRLDPSRDMTSLEQRMNLWMLAEQVTGYGVPGDFAEFGCFDGGTATLFGQVLRDFGPGRRLHLYDRFDVKFHLRNRNIEEEVRRNFEAAGCPQPVIHRGDFERTVPDRLPGCIAFAHIDCGFGGDAREHARMVSWLLGYIYPRMPSGALAVIMDYRHPALTSVEECNPGSRLGADEFMADKPETLTALYAGEACHAFFRKR